MTERKLICIGCPRGCEITVGLDGKEILSIEGNLCPNGEKYARSEVTNPRRIVTTSVYIDGASDGSTMLSCRTASDIPKEMIFGVMEAVRGVRVKAPVRIGDVIVPDAAGSGVDVIATKNID